MALTNLQTIEPYKTNQSNVREWINGDIWKYETNKSGCEI